GGVVDDSPEPGERTQRAVPHLRGVTAPSPSPRQWRYRGNRYAALGPDVCRWVAVEVRAHAGGADSRGGQAGRAYRGDTCGTRDRRWPWGWWVEMSEAGSLAGFRVIDLTQGLCGPFCT